MSFLKKLTYIFTIFILISSNIYADEGDTLQQKVDSSAVFYFYDNPDSAALSKLYYIDTILTGFQQYDPISKHGRFYAGLGNIGLAHHNMIYNPFISNEFDFGIHSFDRYLYKNKTVKYYKLFIPYTKLYFENGAKKEHFFRVTHSQNIARQFTIGLDFSFIHSPGYYERQKSDDKNLFITGQYYTKNKRYGIIANYIHNKLIVEENGGIQSDSAFENNIETDRQLLNVNLQNAQNKIKEAGLFFNQYFYLSKISKNNTTDTIPIKRKLDLGRISHSFSWSRNQFLYEDKHPASLFYQKYDSIIDSTLTHDSTYVIKIKNQLTWSNLGFNDKLEDKIFYIYFSLNYQYIEIGGYAPTKCFNQLIPSGGFSVFILKSFRLNFNAGYTFGNYNNGGFKAHAQIDQFIGNKNKNLCLLKLKATYSNQIPSYFYQHYEANNFRWSSNLKKHKFIIAGVEYSYKTLKLGANLYQLKNFVYFDTLAKPNQCEKSFNVISAFIYKDFKIGKFGIDNKFIYQNVSNSNILRLPELTANVTVHFTQSLFKNAATIQPGIEVYYFTDYYANAYMPALRSFYIQNEKKIGNCFYADVFLNFKIKRVLFFVKYQHFNAGFSGYNYYTVPHYPMQDAAFKFGISWRFYD